MVVRALKSSLVEAKMMRTPKVVMMLALGSALGLAACGTQVPESNPSGVGFQDYNSYIRGAGSQAAGQTGSMTPTTGFSTDAAAAAIAAAEGGTTAQTMATNGAAPLDPTGQIAANGGQAAATSPSALPPINSNGCAGRGNAFAGIQETTSEMNYVQGGVSDEQDFNAVKGRETIASDKQRIECNREQYVVVQPGALPVRNADAGPNIAAFALATTNAPGVKIYNRPPFYLTSPEKACAKFDSPDLAQSAFLAAGGPERDRKALDPDGDGFACSWDPRPFRNAKQ
jgi:hypothetical protein